MSDNFFKVNRGLRLYPQSGTPSNAANGDIYYDTSLNKFRKYENGAWSDLGSGGSGGINHIDNPDFEIDASGWTTYADAAAASPVDGTGGSANITFARSTSSPLRGLAVGLLTKDAVNRQGQGISYDFTIDTADLAKPLKISFDYRANSGTFVAGSDSVVGDLVVYIYDVTNAVLIQPTPYKLTNGSSTVPGTYQAYFQSASNSTSYRLIVHVASTSASAFTVQFDNVSVSPQPVINGVPSSDWTDFTSVIQGSSSNPTKGTTTIDKASYRRVGDSMEIVFSYQQTAGGSAGSGTYLFQMPTGHIIDTNKITASTSSSRYGTVGVGRIDSSDVSSAIGNIKVWNTTSLAFFFNNSGIQGGAWGSTNGGLDEGEVHLSFRAVIPILGWSANVQMSNDTDTRVVAARAALITSPQAIGSGAATKVLFNTTTFDTHGAFDTSANSRYVAQVPGIYKANTSLQLDGLTAGQDATIRLYKNGVQYSDGFFQVASGGFATMQHDDLIQLNAGDYLEVFVSSGGDTSYNITAGAGLSFFDVMRLSGPATIAASETIAIRAHTSTSSTTTGGTETTVFSIKEYDTHGAYNTSTGIFTAPISGKYRVSASFFDGSVTAAATNQGIVMLLQKNGSTYTRLGAYNFQVSGVALSPQVWGDTEINLQAGDTINIACNQNTGNTVTFDTGEQFNWLCVSRIGN